MKTAEDRDSLERSFDRGRPRDRLLLLERLVRPGRVVEVDVLGHDLPEMLLAEDEDVIEPLGSTRPSVWADVLAVVTVAARLDEERHRPPRRGEPRRDGHRYSLPWGPTHPADDLPLGNDRSAITPPANRTKSSIRPS